MIDAIQIKWNVIYDGMEPDDASAIGVLTENDLLLPFN